MQARRNNRWVWALVIAAIALVVIPLLGMVGMMGAGGMMMGGGMDGMMGTHRMGMVWMLLAVVIVIALIVALIRAGSKT